SGASSAWARGTHFTWACIVSRGGAWVWRASWSGLRSSPGRGSSACGPGTLARTGWIGVFSDLLPAALPSGTRSLLPVYDGSGRLLTGFATGLYIAPGLGKGPRDGMMLGIAPRTGWSVRRVRTVIELTVLVLGWALGATIGLGTIVFA